MSKNKRPFVAKDSDDDADFELKPEDDLAGEEFEEITEVPAPSAAKKVKVDKASTSVAQKNSEGDAYFELGPKKRLSIRLWQKNILIDIREYYHDKSGEAKPGKKGISLTKEQFQYILDHASEIKNAIKTTSTG
ncbi:hypothetical protein BGZ65_000167 [Modicella reniformis]|uniref:Transcriptional coactivator p15 (PC4) C-terminal domain-containing protein n=1 Tax=Modicella reniformis TaxID=1440133 RepID=A0A9P6J2N1_9FUNG|nr:hypothetical protein BGZ65_000167 [Modicella reniformis]